MSYKDELNILVLLARFTLARQKISIEIDYKIKNNTQVDSMCKFKKIRIEGKLQYQCDTHNG